MKRLFVTAGAAALMMGAAACSNADSGQDSADIYSDETVAETETAPESETATTAYGTADAMYGTETVTRYDADVDTAIITREIYLPASGEYMASDLIGETVRDASGEDIGEVEDIMLSTANLDPMLIVRDGLAGDLRAVSFEQASVAPNTDGEPEAVLNLLDATLGEMPEFEQEGLNDYRLATEMMGTTVTLGYNEENARVTDFVIAPDGTAKFAVISDGVIEAVSQDHYLINPDRIVQAQGDSDGEFILDITETEFDEAWGIDTAR